MFPPSPPMIVVMVFILVLAVIILLTRRQSANIATPIKELRSVVIQNEHNRWNQYAIQIPPTAAALLAPMQPNRGGDAVQRDASSQLEEEKAVPPPRVLTTEEQDALYHKYVVDISLCVQGEKAAKVLGGVIIAKVFSFIELYRDAGRISRRNFVQEVSRESGLDVTEDQLIAMERLSTNSLEVQSILGNSPDIAMKDIFSRLTTLSAEGLYAKMMEAPDAVADIQLQLRQKLELKKSPPKSLPALSRFENLGVSAKADVVTIRDTLHLSNKKAVVVAETIDKLVGEKNQVLNSTRQKVSYQKSKRRQEAEETATGFHLIGQWILERAPLMFEEVCNSADAELPLGFIRACQVIRGDVVSIVPDSASLDSASIDEMGEHL